jgi:hypothetical protein
MSSLRNKNIHGLWLKTLFFSILLPALVFAQDRQGLLLNADLSVKSDTNITRTGDKTSDTSATFSPQLQFLSRLGQHQFVFDYQGYFTTYNDQAQYNYNDHLLNLDALFDHSERINSQFSFGYQNRVEEPGSNNAQTQLNTDFNQLTRKTANAKLYYGTPASSGQLVLALAHNQRRYTNNQQSYRDVDRNQLTGTFFYRIAPKTRLLFEASTARLDYLPGTGVAAPTSDENLYLAGVEWDATAITSGSFKVGYQQKDYADSRFNDIDGLSYFLDMLWQPNTYTRITIGAKRTTQESAEQDIGGFISTGYSLALEHALSARTHLNGRYTQNESDLSFAQDRTDKHKGVTVGITHSLRTWLDIKLHYRHVARQSNNAIYDFSSDAVELSLSSKFN